MTISQDDLNALLAQAKAIHSGIFAADRFRLDGDQQRATERMLQLIALEVPALMQRLVQMGAVAEEGAGPKLAEVPLELLGTHTNRKRLSLLVDALEESRHIDIERGIDEGGVTHLLSTLVEMVRLEVEGPKGIGE